MENESEIIQINALAQINTVLVCKVKSVDTTNGTVDLDVCVKRPSPIATGGSYAGEELNELMIPCVPIAFYSNSDDCEQAFPVKVGTTGIMICTSEDHGNFWNGQASPVDPARPGRFGLHGFFLPLCVTKDKKPAGLTKTGHAMKSPKFELKTNLSSADKALALAEKVADNLTKIEDAISDHLAQYNNHMHVIGGVVSGTGSGTCAGPLPQMTKTFTKTTTASEAVFTDK